MTTFSFKTCLTALALSAGTPEINPSATKSWFKMEPPANDRCQKSTLIQEDFLIYRLNEAGPPPRINQLDALALDQELLTTLHIYLADTFKFFLKSPLDYVGPEFEALLRLVIWRATHWTKGSSVGQEALGISFLTPSSNQMIGLALIQVGLRYVEQRQSLVVAAFSSLPGRPNLANFFRWTAHATSIIQLLNSLLFLCHGRHSSVASRVLGLQPVSTSDQPRTVAYSYMSRELLWHSFTELLIFLIPILSSSNLKSRIR